MSKTDVGEYIPHDPLSKKWAVAPTKEYIMTKYVLSQQVEVGIGEKMWVDLYSDQSLKQIEAYGERIKEHNPSAKLGIREVTEKELNLNENRY